jgi:curli production assembly/transport component CsgE
MKRLCLAALLLLPLLAFAQAHFEIDGLVIDQTVSRVGHLFYEQLIDGWETPAQSGVIIVRERPDIFAGNMVSVEVNDSIVFEDRVGFRSSGIEEKAQQARSLLESYLQQNKDALRDLGGY